MPNSSNATKPKYSSSNRTVEPADGQFVQRGHTITTETHRTVIKDSKGRHKKTKIRTVYKVDGKIVKLNWFDRLRLRFMGAYEKQAFLAEKLLVQERKERLKRT